jgi:hypothetical protein
MGNGTSARLVLDVRWQRIVVSVHLDTCMLFRISLGKNAFQTGFVPSIAAAA